MKCCGKKQATPFCPQCGAKMSTSPLSGLIEHVQGLIETQASADAEDWWTKYPTQGGSEAHKTILRDRRQAKLAQCNSWLVYLEGLEEKVVDPNE